ncbi:MAG: hypothetical protein F6K36_26870 [Symploca sp. SIO3C6]|uniref:Uncharacterized protein n=1 Tax=Symploca sp. SIO1C4 TaxID=2607765 RepID=A0A6B3NB65_9CYAN|nr:hypothetical protein [Symploca sp. SIO3C6]NER30349.1 hypothetical protein [Symploca sp. SIO1C4]NET05913.1 hypothetical protein [Symploca sp. SIO2B6]
MNRKILSSIIALPTLAAAASYGIYSYYIWGASPDLNSTSYRLTTNILPVLANQQTSQLLLISAGDEPDINCREAGLCQNS